MLIAQITDFHLCAPGALVYEGIDTNGHLRDTVRRLNALSPRPDLVLGTGDLVDHGTVEEYLHLKEILSALEIPIYLIVGNHDDRGPFREVFGDQPYLRGVSGKFLNYAFDAGGVRLIGFDTAVHGVSYGEACEERVAWLDAELARHPDQPTIIFMHHPPFETGIWWMDASRLRGSHRLAEVVQRHRQIRRIWCGHLHRSIFSEWAGVLCSISPSTAHHVSLDMDGTAFMEMLMEPRAFHLHKVEADGRVLTHTVNVELPNERYLPGDRMAGGLDAFRARYQAMYEQMSSGAL
ncbi:MAG: phosphodiesterase [Reyranella sp.]|nr:phosphodiesterase [Reyranella sp.]MDP3161221.1 phosphodiesterase [Reyranella sp.]